ncbi:MAG TPA: DUF6084 family protein [Tepidisphaeraceae bacterium]|jgi:hypothetical protein|nr:DUF6084 family protein [Tepidisphaeraceae bacterium]
MPDLDFDVQGASAVPYAAAPTMAFKLKISQVDDGREALNPIHSVALRCQIRLEPARRKYSALEQERLLELFGEPKRWGQTVKTMLWSHVSVVVPPFGVETGVDLNVPCSTDFNIAAAKYFYALEDGLVPLCFLFSGTIFYADENGALQVSQISWEKESNFRLPVATWKQMMDMYYPNAAWLCLQKDVFDRLYKYKSERAMSSWEQAVESLLAAADAKAVV